MEERLAGAVHIAERLVIVGLSWSLSQRSCWTNYAYSHRIEINGYLLDSLVRRRAPTFIAQSKSSMTLVNSLSISSILYGWASPLNDLSATVSICQSQKKRPAHRNTHV
jgi:hypothetical protein